MQSEQRHFVRRGIWHEMIAILPDGLEVTCVLADISEGGAQIALETPRKMPRRFRLRIQGNLPVHRLCETVWQEGAMLGVRFLARK